MSKNTQISELINYISVNESGNVVFTTVPAATTNTDKFLVSDSGVLKFRTAAQLLSDIGAQASGSYQAALSGTGFVKISGSTISYDNSTYLTTSSASSTYLPLSGGTLTGGLGGTTATFSGTISGGGNLELINAGGPYVLVGEGTGVNQYGVTDWDATNNVLRIATQPYAFGANGGQLNLTTGGNVLIGTTNTGADGLNINNQRNLSFSEGSGESYVNVFRQRNSAALVMGAGYKRSVTGAFASSFSSAMARAAIAIGYNNGSIVFFTDTSSTVANGTDITPTERLVILSSGDIQTKGGTVYFGASNTGDIFVSPSNGYMYFEYPTSYGAIFRTQGGTEAVRYLSSGQATFANIVRTDNPIQVGAGSNNYYTQVTTAYNYPYVDSYFDSVAGASYEGRLNFRTNTGGGSMTTQLSITNAGVATFSNGIISSDGYQGRYYRLREASANRGGLYPFNLVFGSGTDYSIGIFSEGEIFLAPGGSATKRFTMNNAGAASFTGALTVGGTIVINNGGGVTATGGFSTNAGGLQIANGNQTVNAACAQIEFGNRGYFSTANVGAAKIEARSTGGSWYSGTALAFYTNPGPDVTATSPVERITIGSNGDTTIRGYTHSLYTNNGNTISFDVNVTRGRFYQALTVDGAISAGSTVTGPQGVNSVSTTTSISFTSWTTIVALDANTVGMLFVVIGLTGGGALSDWTATGIIYTNGTTASWISGPINGTLVQLRLNGLAIQVYQNGTSPSISLNCKVLKVS